jgi:hypothetical protein
MLYSPHPRSTTDVLPAAASLTPRTIQIPRDLDRECKGYRWPATRLTRADMKKLLELRTKTGRPITVLIHIAVAALYELLRDDTLGDPTGA